MERQEVRWEHYPLVAEHAAARTFVERLVLKGKSPKTVDAYARAIEDLLSYFRATDISRVIEAEEADLDYYIADLKQRRKKKRGRGGMIEEESNVRSLTGHMLSENTIAQRLVACRLFYDFLIRKNIRVEFVNPITRGNDGRNGQRPVMGPLRRKKRLPWVPSDDVWEQLLHHVLLKEDARTQAMILLAYDAALRREELVSLRVDDIDWTYGVVTIRAETTKGGRMRHVPVSEACLHVVRTYLEGDRRVLIIAYDGETNGSYATLLIQDVV